METMRAATATDYEMHRRTVRARSLSTVRMPANGALGVINGITARWDRKEMFIFGDRLVLVSAGDMFARTIAHQFGLIGMLIYSLGTKLRDGAAGRRRQESFAEV